MQSNANNTDRIITILDTTCERVPKNEQVVVILDKFGITQIPNLYFQYENIFLEGNRNEKSFFEKMYKLAFTLPIGKLYIKGIKSVIMSLNSQRTIDSLSSQFT